MLIRRKTNSTPQITQHSDIFGRFEIFNILHLHVHVHHDTHTSCIHNAMNIYQIYIKWI